MNIKEIVLKDIEDFQKLHNLNDRKLGLAISNDHNLITRVRTKNVSTATLEKLYNYMKNYNKIPKSEDDK